MTDPMQTELEADLHSRIMNLPREYPPGCENDSERRCYRVGHKDARHAAAELAAESASELRSLRDALALARSHIGELERAVFAVSGGIVMARDCVSSKLTDEALLHLGHAEAKCLAILRKGTSE